MNPRMLIKSMERSRPPRRFSLAPTLVILAPVIAMSLLSCDDDNTSSPTSTSRGNIQGTVTDAATQSPIPVAVVGLLSTTMQAVCDTAGHYTLSSAPRSFRPSR